jgi:periplasmic copper chaperone A
VQAAAEAAAAAELATPPDNAYFEMQTTRDLMAHLEIVPGTVGENTFYVSLIDEETGLLVEDATLIRLRFDHLAQNLGQSELRPELESEFIYIATGANLSVPGEWRIRMTVQRPQKFDAVMDFEANILPAASPPPLIIETAIPAAERGIAALAVGLFLLGTGGFFVARERLISGAGVLGAGMALVGVITLVIGGQLLLGANGTVTVRDAWARPAGVGETGAVYLTIENGTGETIQLTSAQTDAAQRVELHRTTIEDEVARMEAFDTLAVAPGDTLRIEPLGTHLMLEHLHRALIEGDTFPLTLTFASGETLTVEVQVQMNAPE